MKRKHKEVKDESSKDGDATQVKSKRNKREIKKEKMRFYPRSNQIQKIIPNKRNISTGIFEESLVPLSR